MSFRPAILSYEQVNSAAEGFLKKYHPTDNLPIPIEEIIEFGFGIDIIPFPNLQRDFDIEGFIAGDMSCIYVDEFVYRNRYSRYRFTLAHEIGHAFLHRGILSEIRPKAVAEWQHFIETVDPDAYDWIEYQAYAFGGLVLVPRSDLLERCRREVGALQQKIQEAKLAELPRDSYSEYVVEAVATRLLKIYDVSIDVMRKRISKEAEKGNFVFP